MKHITTKWSTGKWLSRSTLGFWFSVKNINVIDLKLVSNQMQTTQMIFNIKQINKDWNQISIIYEQNEVYA